MDWITILGLIAATCTTISFLPQALKAIRTKQTKDLSLPMWILSVIGVSLWLIYGALIRDIPLISANLITLIFGAIVLALKIRYG